MDGFTRNDLRTALELSSMCVGVFDGRNGQVHSLNRALKQAVKRPEFRVTVTCQTDDRMFGRLVEGDVPVSLRVLSGQTPACLVEVYLAHTKECSSRSDVIELVEMTSDGVWEWFPSLNYEFMSKRFWSILGYDHREMPSSPDAWRSKIDPRDFASAMACFKAHVATKGVAPYNLNVSYTHKKGHVVKVKCRGAVVEWLPDGTPWRMLGTHTDITEISEAVEARVRFVSRMSHEIRTPISAILHECELLDNHHETAVIADACAQLLALCNDILTLEKLSWSKALKLETQSTSLEEFLRKAIRRNFRQAEKKGVALTGKVHTVPPRHLAIDVSKCNQVVDNLISNAIKYTEMGGSITVELYCRAVRAPSDPPASNEARGGRDSNECGDAGCGSSETPCAGNEVQWEAEVLVRDNGVGIPAKDQELVFDRFMQASSSTQGAGLGLSISRELACLLGGDVVLRESNPGTGSTFVFSFRESLAPTTSSISPARTPEAVETVHWRGKGTGVPGDGKRELKAQGEAVTRGNLHTGKSNGDTTVNGGGTSVIRILNADDMLTNRKIIRRRLLAIRGKLGAEVIEVVDAVNGRDAVRIFRDLGSFNLVFMDCLMPELNGFGATREIHRLCDERNIPRVPVVAITASVSTVLHRECMEAGMCQVITKPFNTLDLVTVLAVTIGPEGKRERSPTTPPPPRVSATAITASNSWPAPAMTPVPKQTDRLQESAGFCRQPEARLAARP